MDQSKTQAFVDANWPKFVEGLSKFVTVPNLTPNVSDTFLKDGLIEQAFDVVHQFAEQLNLKGLSYETFSQDGTAPPMRVYTIEGHQQENCPKAKHVMLYSHLDKQPWGPDWDTNPIEPVIKNDKLFGRGTSDDGYAAYLCFLAIKNIQDQGVPHPKFTILLESEEESGSAHILKLMEDAKDVIGTPDLIFIIDSGTLDYKALWVTATMRGIVNVDVEIDVLTGGVHSGVSGGIIPEPHRIMRLILDRLEDSATGMVKLPEVSTPVPDHFRTFAATMVDRVGDELWTSFPWVDGVKPINHGDNLELYLRNTWHAAMAVIGIKGLPETKIAGNAMNPKLSFRLSFRISPDVNPHEAAKSIKSVIESNPPYGCKIVADPNHRGFGYNQKPLPDALSTLLESSSQTYYGNPCRYFGLGATIPLLTELDAKFPNAYIIATGVLGPDTNAHGPNESIDLPYTKKFMGLFSTILGSL